MSNAMTTRLQMMIGNAARVISAMLVLGTMPLTT